MHNSGLHHQQQHLLAQTPHQSLSGRCNLTRPGSYEGFHSNTSSIFRQTEESKSAGNKFFFTVTARRKETGYKNKTKGGRRIRVKYKRNHNLNTALQMTRAATRTQAIKTCGKHKAVLTENLIFRVTVASVPIHEYGKVDYTQGIFLRKKNLAICNRDVCCHVLETSNIVKPLTGCAKNISRVYLRCG